MPLSVSQHKLRLGELAGRQPRVKGARNRRVCASEVFRRTEGATPGVSGPLGKGQRGRATPTVTKDTRGAFSPSFLACMAMNGRTLLTCPGQKVGTSRFFCTPEGWFKTHVSYFFATLKEGLFGFKSVHFFCKSTKMSPNGGWLKYGGRIEISAKSPNRRISLNNGNINGTTDVEVRRWNSVNMRFHHRAGIISSKHSDFNRLHPRGGIVNGLIDLRCIDDATLKIRSEPPGGYSTTIHI